MRELKFRMLIINSSLNSTKIGVFENEISIFEKIINHHFGEGNSYKRITDQAELRKNSILETLHNEGINISKLDAVCGRGGLLRPIEGGTYEVNEQMLQDLRCGFSGEHASNLGGILAYTIASGLNIPAYIVDPVVIDELEPIARISGFPFIERKSIFHALNQKAAARRVAKELGRHYEEMNLIVAHLGRGITIGVHKQGRVVDVNDGLHGEGPFSPERAGTVPTRALINLCFSGRYNEEEVISMLVEKSGFVGYLGTIALVQVERMVRKGDKQAELIYSAMAYQVAKEIGSASAVLAGAVDAIVLTGELAEGKGFTEQISDRVNWIADVFVHPGENELLALAEGTLRVLHGEEEAKEYPNVKVSIER